MRTLTLVFSISALFFSCQKQVKYDTILRNGLIYDGSGGDPFSADLGINADTIAVIGDLSGSLGKSEFNLNGLAVAPGFINMLSWANVALIADGRSQGDIRQGVTLEVMGEGSSMGPLNDVMKQEMLDDQVDIKFSVDWTTLGEYLTFLETRGVSTNVASFVGNGTLRKHVIGYENRIATEEEIEEMRELVHQAMQEGAVGISSSLLYAPSGYANTEELIELSKVASQYDGMYISHIRNEGDQLVSAIEELIRISKEAEIAAEVYHLKASGVNNWNKLDSAVALIEDARAEGHKVTADIYTYPASSTGLHVQLPDWAREGGVDATIARISQPDLRKQIIADFEFRNPPNTILFVGFKKEEMRKYVGKRLDEVAAERGQSPEETVIDMIVQDDSRIQVVYFSMSDENLAKKVAIPWVSFCSDAGSYTNEGVFIKQSTHPRAYGSFIRVLGKYARDENVITLEEGIRKLSSLPAENLKLKKRGSLKVGNFADVVVFDPERVKDNATFEDPHQYAEGVLHVWVNGEQVLKGGEHTGATPGRFVRGPGWKK